MAAGDRPGGPILRFSTMWVLLGFSVVDFIVNIVPVTYATRSPSHDASVSKSFRDHRSESTAFNSLPKPLAGLDRLGRESCISKLGAAACRNSNALARGSRLPGSQPDLQTLLNSRPTDKKRTLSVRRSARGSSVTKGRTSKGFELISENVVWESPGGGHMTVFEKIVEMPDGGDGDDDGGSVDAVQNRKLIKWHVLGSPVCNFSSVVVFPFDTRTQTCTLIHEYCPGTNSILSGVPGGSFEPYKHMDLATAARHELNEEAGLNARELICLAPNGIPADKYSANRLYPFLALDCTIDPNPLPKDDTEFITVERGVTLRDVMARSLAGEMPAPSVMTTMLAIEKLRQLRIIN